MSFFREQFSSRLSLTVLGIICVLSLSFMLWASLGDSAIMDELAHIPAGYGYVHNLDYRLNPEHPPLIKALAAFPLLFLNPDFPTGNSAWTTDVNGQWVMGAEFLYGSGNNPNLIVRVARIAPILLTLLLIILIYFWSRELLGNRWALVPAFLFGFSPTVLAHGHYVTTDIGAALGVVLGTYFFVRFLSSPSKHGLLYTGIAFGLAQLMKFSAVLLIPYFFILLLFFFAGTVVRDWPETDPRARFKRFFTRAWRYLRSIIIIFVVGYVLVVYPAYFLFTFNEPVQKQSSDTEFILGSFAGGPAAAGHPCAPLLRCVADADVWMSKHQITRPFAEYLLGVLMVLQRSSGGNTSYFLGEISNLGSRYYFPAVYFFKESIPTLLIIFIALFLSVRAIIKRIKNYKSKVLRYFFADYLGVSFAEFSMLVFILFYWAYSMKSPLNIGVRHLLPTIPFIYILAASSWKRWFGMNGVEKFGFRFEWFLQWLKSLTSLFLKNILLLALLAWLLLETFFSAPYFLSYFNEIGGGTWNGYHIVTDSNYDWGQDLLRLQTFVAAHPEIDKIAVDYFGGGSPKYYLGPKETDWRSLLGNPADQGIHWLAVSVNTLESATQPLALGQTRNPEDEYRWLTSLRPPKPGFGNLSEPDFKAGTSIFIYTL